MSVSQTSPEGPERRCDVIDFARDSGVHQSPHSVVAS